MKVVIMSGISGSGKDTYIENNFYTEHYPPSICSADDYFMKDNKYQFNHSKLNEAHGYCLKKFLYSIDEFFKVENDMKEEASDFSMMRFGRPTIDKDIEEIHSEYHIVINNTNTTAIEIAPYFAIASAYKAEIELVTLLVDPKVAAARNVHGVPLESCIAMDKRLRSRSLPKFWNYKNTVVNQ
jgi:hypothetical protein